jgi:MerR family transcriptional regulator/heat shock protein HspR
MKKKKGYFSISAVSDMLGIHQQTIRLYEREGLITPRRSEGNTRMFSEEDVERLEQVIYYTNKLGVNLAGVEIILRMQKRIDRLQNQVNDIFTNSREELEQEKIVYNARAEEAKNAIASIRKKTDIYSDEELSHKKLLHEERKIAVKGLNPKRKKHESE